MRDSSVCKLLFSSHSLYISFLLGLCITPKIQWNCIEVENLFTCFIPRRYISRFLFSEFCFVSFICIVKMCVCPSFVYKIYYFDTILQKKKSNGQQQQHQISLFRFILSHFYVFTLHLPEICIVMPVFTVLFYSLVI